MRQNKARVARREERLLVCMQMEAHKQDLLCAEGVTLPLMMSGA